MVARHASRASTWKSIGVRLVEQLRHICGRPCLKAGVLQWKCRMFSYGGRDRRRHHEDPLRRRIRAVWPCSAIRTARTRDAPAYGGPPTPMPAASASGHWLRWLHCLAVTPRVIARMRWSCRTPFVPCVRALIGVGTWFRSRCTLMIFWFAPSRPPYENIRNPLEDASFQAGFRNCRVFHEPDADDFQSMRNVTSEPRR